jgi:hypothetical protein
MEKQRVVKQFVEAKGELQPGEGIEGYEYASELSTDKMPLIDPGGGPVNVIRVFNFKMNPEKKDFTNKQAIFSAHAKQIETLLWGDGLRPLENINPRVILNNKQGIYQIFVPCGAAKGVIFSERDRNPELLHKQLAKGKLDSRKK